MNFRDYYEAEQFRKTYRIKTAGRIGDDELDIIEKVLSKYRPDSISTPRKMIFQTTPLGFTGIKNVEVWFIDAVLTVPAHGPTLENDLRSSFGLGAASPLIIVEEEGTDPIEDQEEILSREHGALLTDPDYSEVDKIDPSDYTGDEYNGKLLDYIKKAEADRLYKQEIDAPHPITKWERQPKVSEPSIDKRNYNDLLDKQPTFRARTKPANPRGT